MDAANKFAVRYLFGADAEAVKRERDAAALAAVERAASEKRERDAAALAAVEQEKRDKHSAFIASRKNKEDVMDDATELNDDVFAFIEGESPQRLSPQMKFAKGAHDQGRVKGDFFGGKRRSKSHRKAHRKSHRKSHRKAHRKACRKASRKAHRKSCRCD
jgi:hypothetical protein